MYPDFRRLGIGTFDLRRRFWGGLNRGATLGSVDRLSASSKSGSRGKRSTATGCLSSSGFASLRRSVLIETSRDLQVSSSEDRKGSLTAVSPRFPSTSSPPTCHCS